MMKKVTLSLMLGLITLASFSQTAFVSNTTYRQGSVVWYPTNSPENYYRSNPISFKAKKAPNVDPANWFKIPYEAPTPVPVVVVPTPVPVAPTPAPTLNVDSLLKVNKAIQTNIDFLTGKITALETKFANLPPPVVQLPGTGVIKLSNWGVPLFTVKGDTIILKSLLDSKDIKFLSTEATLQPIKTF